MSSKTIDIRPTKGLASLQLGLLWEYRELLYYMIWRDIKVRYKQTFLGILWIVFQPIITIVIFSVLFGGLLGVPSDGAPYPIFLYSALLAWDYFASALTRASSSMVASGNIITKVYFPRLILPLSAVLGALVDFAISAAVFAGLMLYFQIVPTPAILLLPAFVLLAMLTALGFGLWLAALNVRYRDVNQITPFIVRTWMYLTPVIYSATLLPEEYRWILSLNPMTGVVAGFRWAILGNYLDYGLPPSDLFIVAIIITIVVLISGAFYFRSTERAFADII